MQLNLKGKVVLVTGERGNYTNLSNKTDNFIGGTKGIGRAIVEGL